MSDRYTVSRTLPNDLQEKLADPTRKLSVKWHDPLTEKTYVVVSEEDYDTLCDNRQELGELRRGLDARLRSIETMTKRIYGAMGLVGK